MQKIILNLSILILLFSCKSLNKNNQKKILYPSDLQNIYETSLTNFSPYYFRKKDANLELNNKKYGMYTEGIKGLVFYSQFMKSIAELAGNEVSGKFGSFAALEKLSGVSAFTTGEKEFQGYGIIRDGKQDFHHYNPEMIRWGMLNLIPDPDLNIFGISAQEIYNKSFQHFFRMMTETHFYITEKRNFKQEQIAYKAFFDVEDFNGIDYLSQNYGNRMAKYYFSETNVQMTPYMAIGFWLRRGIDGTEKDCWKALSFFMEKFDPEFLDELKK